MRQNARTLRQKNYAFVVTCVPEPAWHPPRWAPGSGMGPWLRGSCPPGPSWASGVLLGLTGAQVSSPPHPAQSGGPRPVGLRGGCRNRGDPAASQGRWVITPALQTTWTPAQHPSAQQTPPGPSQSPVLASGSPRVMPGPRLTLFLGPQHLPSPAMSPEMRPWPHTPPPSCSEKLLRACFPAAEAHSSCLWREAGF